ncbi:MAG: hypothetical protein RR730_06945 [Clostridium sp.]
MLKKIYSFLWIGVLGFIFGIIGMPFILNTSIGQEVVSKFNGEGLDTFKYKNYTILASKESEVGMPIIYANLDNTEKKLSSITGFTPDENLTIKITTKEESSLNKIFKQDEISNLGGAYTNKKIHLFANSVYEDILTLGVLMGDDFYKSLNHEYTHYFFDMYCKSKGIEKSKIPQWFEDGLCEYIGNDSVAYGQEFIDFTPFNQITSNKDWKDHIPQNYFQSHLALNKIVSLKGEKVINSIIIRCKELSFEDSFKESTGVDISKFEEGIKSDCAKYGELMEEYAKKKDKVNNRDILIKCLEKYIVDNPKTPDAYCDIAQYYKSKGNNEKAVKVTIEGLRHNPNDDRLKRAYELYNK